MQDVPLGFVAASTTVDREHYAGLFTRFGVKYGEGNGHTTFKLPDGPPGDPEGGLWIIRA